MQTLLHRSIAVLFALTVVAGFWHAAGGSREDFDKEQGTTWLVPITYMKPAYERLAETFRQTHPDIPLRVIWVPGNEYQMKFKTLAAAGDAPDVLYTGDVWVAYMLPFLRPITDFVERDLEEIELEDFYPEVLKAIQHEGDYYFLPVHINVSLLYYNKKLFDEAGLTYPDRTWTWDDLVHAASRIRRTLPDGTEIWGCDMDPGWWGEWLMYVRQSGGRMFNEDLTRCLLDSPEAIRGVEFYRDKVLKYDISPRPGYGPTTRFASGRIGLVCGGHTTFWRIYNKVPDLEWDIEVLPLGPVRRNGGEIAVGAYAISKDSRNPELAWELVKHLASKEGVAAECRAGGVPTRRSVAEELMLGPDRNENPRNVQAAFDQMPYAMPIPRSPDYIEIAIEVIQPEIDRMLQGQQTPEEACRRATEAANRFIETLGRGDRSRVGDLGTSN